MSKLTKESLLRFKNKLTVGELKAYIEKYKLEDDAIVMVQRVEDRYYEGFDISGMRGIREDGTGGILPVGSKSSGWDVYPKEGESYHAMKNHNEKVLSGKFDNREQYPLMTESHKKLFTIEDMEEAKDQYTPVSSAVRYNDDKDILFLDLHI